MMIVAVLLFGLLCSDLITSQIPNPDQYKFTLTYNGLTKEQLAIDKHAGKISRKWYSNGNLEFGGNQHIYVRDDGRNYLFNFMAKPPQCIANRAGPLTEMNYWPNLVQSFGGENKTYDQLIFDKDCDGTCLTWLIEYNSTYHQQNFNTKKRLYVKKAEQKPIKHVVTVYDLDAEKLVSTDVTRFADWITGKPSDYEFDYPMDLKTCYKP